MLATIRRRPRERLTAAERLARQLEIRGNERLLGSPSGTVDLQGTPAMNTRAQTAERSGVFPGATAVTVPTTRARTGGRDGKSGMVAKKPEKKGGRKDGGKGNKKGGNTKKGKK